MRLGNSIDNLGINTDCFPYIPKHASCTVRRYRGSNSRTVTTILSIDVLHDGFSLLMFEIDIDVRMTITFPADEPFEQHR